MNIEHTRTALRQAAAYLLQLLISAAWFVITISYRTILVTVAAIGSVLVLALWIALRRFACWGDSTEQLTSLLCAGNIFVLIDGAALGLLALLLIVAPLPTLKARHPLLDRATKLFARIAEQSAPNVSYDRIEAASRSTSRTATIIMGLLALASMTASLMLLFWDSIWFAAFH